MWNWKPIPEDVDAKERSLRVACISVSVIMIVWVCFIGGNAIAETASSGKPVPAQKSDTDILECRYDDQMEKESKKKKQSESKSSKKHLQTSKSSGKTVKHSDEEPVSYESDESYEEPVYYEEGYGEYEEPAYYDESYGEYEEPAYYDESYGEYEDPTYYDESYGEYEELSYYEEGYEENEVEEDYDEAGQGDYEESQVDSEISEDDSEEDVYYTSDELRNKGEVYDDGQRYTWYSQNVLPGEGLDIPGRHVEEGYVVDEEGNVVLAGSEDKLGEEVDIPFGSGNGKVYDVCGVEGTLDVYTDF